MKLIIENLQEEKMVSTEIYKIMEEAARLCVEQIGLEIPCEISVFLVDDNYIREINKEQRNIDKPTDVLSFPMLEMDSGVYSPVETDFDLDQDLLVLGDIIISLETAKRQAEEYGHSFFREAAFLLTHGVFHLLGFDHENSEDERRMMEQQEQVLQKLNLGRSNEK